MLSKLCTIINYTHFIISGNLEYVIAKIVMQYIFNFLQVVFSTKCMHCIIIMALKAN